MRGTGRCTGKTTNVLIRPIFFPVVQEREREREREDTIYNLQFTTTRGIRTHGSNSSPVIWTLQSPSCSRGTQTRWSNPSPVIWTCQSPCSSPVIQACGSSSSPVIQTQVITVNQGNRIKFSPVTRNLGQTIGKPNLDPGQPSSGNPSGPPSSSNLTATKLNSVSLPNELPYGGKPITVGRKNNSGSFSTTFPRNSKISISGEPKGRHTNLFVPPKNIFSQ